LNTNNKEIMNPTKKVKNVQNVIFCTEIVADITTSNDKREDM